MHLWDCLCAVQPSWLEPIAGAFLVETAVTFWCCDLPVLWPSGYSGSPVAVAWTCDASQMIGVPFAVQYHWKFSSILLLSTGLSMGTDVPAMLGSVMFAAIGVLIAM